MAQRTGFNKGGGLGGMARGEMGWKGNECEERDWRRGRGKREMDGMVGKGLCSSPLPHLS